MWLVCEGGGVEDSVCGLLVKVEVLRTVFCFTREGGGVEDSVCDSLVKVEVLGTRCGVDWRRVKVEVLGTRFVAYW